jgi:hypothetical protein
MGKRVHKIRHQKNYTQELVRDRFSLDFSTYDNN